MDSKNTVAVVKAHTSVEFHEYIRRVPTLNSAVVATDREAAVSLVVAVCEDGANSGFLCHMYTQSPADISEFGLAADKQDIEFRPGSANLGNLIKGFLEGLECETLIEIGSGRMRPGWVAHPC